MTSAWLLALSCRSLSHSFTVPKATSYILSHHYSYIHDLFVTMKIMMQLYNEADIGRVQWGNQTI